jgi:hydrogenase nickel incorporation protein HypA/HybF
VDLCSTGAQGAAERKRVHELSIAESILDIVTAEAVKRQAPAVIAIKLRLGEFTGVVREALEFAFEIARQGTLAEQAVLEIESVPLETRCPVCALTARPGEDFCLVCERCGRPVDILSGREMQVEYVDLAERAATDKEEVPWTASP